ncbi:MAG: hypothetical protein J0M21_09645 [Xanthomonadales bacterium]|nr:hypothetical protein [Xanthomonadales bacterium]
MKPHESGSPVDDARWQSQERARHANPEADSLDLRIAHALRTPPPVALPQDFAARVAALAQARAVADSRLEQGLLRGLVLVFALSAAVVVAWFGRGWVATLAATLPGGQSAIGWGALAACCLLGNWGLGALRRLHHGERGGFA